MNPVWTFCLLLNTTFVYLSVSSLVTSLGTYFMYTGPRYREHSRKTILSLFTPVSMVVDIKVSTVLSTGVHSPKEIQLVKSKSQEVNLELIFTDNEEISFMFANLTGNGEFGVNVLYYGTKGASLATTMVLPVSAYGDEYYVFTLTSLPYYFVQFPEDGFKLELPRQTIRGGGIREQFLHFYTNNGMNNPEYCNFSSNTALNGRVARSRGPIGVIAGSCETVEKYEDCVSLKERSSDTAMEWLLPSYSAGKSFILFAVGWRFQKGYVSAVATDLYSDLELYEKVNGSVNVRRFSVEPPQGIIQIHILTVQHRLLQASQPVQCYYVQVSSCGSEQGDTSMSAIIPTVLFFNRYIWSLPFEHDFKPKNFVIFVMNRNENEALILDGLDLKLYQTGWNKVVGAEEWFVVEMALKTDRHLHYAKAPSSRPFGCYLYGVGPDYGYMQVAGVMMAKINSKEECINSVESMKEGDMLDNDCDGQFDEEILNAIDDDWDTFVDEDLISTVPVDFNTDTYTPPVKFSESSTDAPRKLPSITDAQRKPPSITDAPRKPPSITDAPRDHSITDDQKNPQPSKYFSRDLQASTYDPHDTISTVQDKRVLESTEIVIRSTDQGILVRSTDHEIERDPAEGAANLDNTDRVVILLLILLLLTLWCLMCCFWMWCFKGKRHNEGRDKPVTTVVYAVPERAPEKIPVSVPDKNPVSVPDKNPVSVLDEEF